MARRASVVKQERESNDGIVLLLDAGGSLLGHRISYIVEGANTVEAMNLLAYDALTVGRRELEISPEAVEQRVADADFPFLSANVVTLADSQLVFEPYVIIERQGARIGILGLSEVEAAQSPRVSKVFTVLDPIEAAREFVPQLVDQVDLLIVLSHLGLEKDQELAQEVSGIDIIIGGNTRQLMREPELVGKTLIVQQGYRGEWIGRLDATFDAQKTPIEYIEEIITLGDEYADDPEMLELLAKYNLLYPSPTPQPTPTATPAE